MNKILCVVGPTASGKTKKAVELSLKQPSILISADSRQVYRGMDIVTGKDHPANMQLHGIDIVEPNQACSVSVWHDSVLPHITKAIEEGKLPIVVGGTGLYIRSLTEGIETMKVPINQSLRDKLVLFSVSDLQNELSKLNQEKYLSLNHSDQNNPRRLIRAIEIAQSNFSVLSKSNIFESKIIGLRPPEPILYRKMVEKRVLLRIENGAIEETKNLLLKYGKDIQAMSAIGYRSIIKYLEGKYTSDEMIENWVTDELGYAKRQLTWFRKQPVIWYDVTTTGE